MSEDFGNLKKRIQPLPSLVIHEEESLGFGEYVIQLFLHVIELEPFHHGSVSQH